MPLIVAAVAWIVGICFTQYQAQLFERSTLGWGLGLCLVLCGVGCGGGYLAVRCAPRLQARQGLTRLLRLTVVLCGSGACVLAGGVYSQWAAHHRLADRLVDQEINRVTRMTVVLTGLPTQQGDSVSVQVQAIPEAPLGRHRNALPQHIQVSWPATFYPPDRPLMPGQLWRVALRLRPVHGRLNPGGFDQEALWFARGVSTSGQVRGHAKAMGDKPFYSLEVWANRMRFQIRQAMVSVLGSRPATPVLIALAIGDQQGVHQADWQVFSLTGITHLVSISGSHVTLVAALGGWVVNAWWRRRHWRGLPLCEYCNARLASMMAAVIVAFFYCLLAGWGVPAQRTFFMVLWVAISYGLSLPLTGMSVVGLAAVCLTVLDPWAVLSMGFWLSFMAVSILMMLGKTVVVTRRSKDQGHRLRRWCQSDMGSSVLSGLILAAQLQWRMTLALVPVLAWLFNQVSWVSLFANAVAIPVMTFVVTPLALLLAGLSTLSGLAMFDDIQVLIKPILSALAVLAHEPLAWTIAWVKTLATIPYAALDIPSPSVWAVSVALIGVLWAVWPPFLSGAGDTRWLGWLMITPVLVHPNLPLEDGHWQLHVFDIGQGSAMLFRTREHDLIVDTGWQFQDQSAMNATLWPSLRALGLKPNPTVVISHHDLDHVGGLEALQHHTHLGRLISPALTRGGELCQMGQGWTWNQVRFTFVAPDPEQCPISAAPTTQARHKNRCGCVLHVQGRYHSVLFTGDIDHLAEKSLLPRLTGPVDVVLVPHHGARTSSSAQFIHAVRAQHAIAQLGYLNRFGHPEAGVVHRWHQAGSRFWRTDSDGAIALSSTSTELSVQSERLTRARYWHNILSR